MKSSRSTLAKTAIEELMTRAGHALSHQDIQHALGDICNRVTIYRVLDRMEQEGKVHKIIGMDGITKYATCHDCSTQHSDDHVHFSCTVCHSVTCLDEVIPTFDLPSNYHPMEVNFTISGICPNCATQVNV